ncbi:MAG: nucleotide exchange factor GrpE [Clostridiales bacterium]|nr:nucleotide exchange factor GrpE [Clostridiales bacterium]MBR5041071.1 nucleotide exchange factor GrpE [Clostridiales bacterium]
MKKHNENEEPIELNTEGEEEVMLDGDVAVEAEVPEEAEEASAEDADADGEEVLEATEDAEDATAAELAELKDRYMRLLAEYDNFRRRTQKEKEALYLDSVAEVVKEWLPLVDDIERAVASSENMDESSVEKVAEGIKLIGKQAGNVLSKLGVEEIEGKEGETFDPNLHEAVMHIEDDSLGEQEIAQVFQKGYTCKGKVIRHTVVKVAN